MAPASSSRPSLPTLPSPDRRTFCGAACAAVAIGAAGLGTSGCGNTVDPAPYLDAALDDNPASMTYGQVAIPVAEYPQLAALGGAVTVRVQAAKVARSFFVPDGGVLLVHRDAPGAADEYVAVQSLCPHQQCPLGYSPSSDLVECPCHGSRFRTTADPNVTGTYVGQVTHLPARDDLSAWMVKVVGGIARIDFRSQIVPGAAAAMVVGGLVTIPITALPGLQIVGGSAILAPSGLGDTIILLRRDATTIVTLSAICTHAGCKVEYEAAGDDLLCPCHSSHFSIAGAVTAGAAKAPLKVYPTDFDGTTVVVHAA